MIAQILMALNTQQLNMFNALGVMIAGLYVLVLLGYIVMGRKYIYDAAKKLYRIFSRLYWWVRSLWPAKPCTCGECCDCMPCGECDC